MVSCVGRPRRGGWNVVGGLKGGAPPCKPVQSEKPQKAGDSRVLQGGIPLERRDTRQTSMSWSTARSGERPLGSTNTKDARRSDDLSSASCQAPLRRQSQLNEILTEGVFGGVGYNYCDRFESKFLHAYFLVPVLWRATGETFCRLL